MAKKGTKTGGYNAEHITVLEGLEPVRKRPGMYIGSTGQDGINNLVREVFDNSRDEAMAGFAEDVEVSLLPGNRVRVADNGRGVPVDIHRQTKVSALETIMTTLHAGGKFGGEGYTVTGGLHGVGVSVVNALSIFARAEVHRDGGIFVQEYTQGVRLSPVKRVGASKLHGTIITFEPDPAIFKEGIHYDWKWLADHMREQAYLVKGLRISLRDFRDRPDAAIASDGRRAFYLRELGIEAPSLTFYFDGGLYSLIRFYNQFEKPVHKSIFHVEKNAGDMGVESVEVALQYIDDISSRLIAFANNTLNSEGGTHVTGFKTALTRTLNTYARKNNLVKESEDNFAGDDVLEGLTAVVSIKMREIQFEGQTKGKLGSVEARGAVESVFSDTFGAFLEENPDDARSIVGKVTLALKARKAAKAAKDSVLRKGAFDGMTLPGKLADCQSKNRDESEIFIIEGDSAGGCFSGETKVALLDGRDLSFKDLVQEHRKGKKNYCYTIDSDDAIAVALVENPRITKKNAEVIKITLDNDRELTCTPDHRFMLRDGTYKEARQLTLLDSLMPLYRKHSKKGGRITINGYEMVRDPKNNHWIFTHLLSDQFNQRKQTYTRMHGDVIHHIDFNKLNNNPDNLKPLGKCGHMLFRTEHLEKTLHRPGIKIKATATRRTPRFREQARKKSLEKRELFSENAQKQWANLEYKAYMARKFLEFYEKNQEYRDHNNALLNRVQQEYGSNRENRIAQAKRTRKFFEQNHERKELLSCIAKKQWQNQALPLWRSEKTKKQWTKTFRRQQRHDFNQIYLQKALDLLHGIYYETGRIDYARYNEVRRERNDKTLIRHDTVCSRFFDGDRSNFEEAIVQYNHRIKKVEFVQERIDVYDLEVPETHNFALASGVFVHNSAKMARDRRTQAILPLFGKVLNVERARLDRVLMSDKFKSLVIAMGAGIGDEFNLEKLRYGKIIIMADADVDGAHIKTLYLTFFYRYFRSVVDAGHVYVAVPPLYKIARGREARYVFTDDEKAAYLKGLGVSLTEVDDVAEEEGDGAEEQPDVSGGDGKTKKTPKVNIQRYKGLGEMNADELWETTMDPARRKLKQVTIEDAAEADHVFDVLMGTDVPARKAFIQTNAKLANIDI